MLVKKKVAFVSVLNILTVSSYCIISEMNNFTILLTAFCIIITFLCMRPRYLLHPNNIVFAYFCCYLVLAPSIFVIYSYFNIQHVLAWSIPDFIDISKFVYLDMLLVFYVLFYSFYYFLNNIEIDAKFNYEVSKKNIGLLLIIFMFVLVIFIFLSGGLLWLQNYKEAYLIGRKGLGLLSLAIIFLSILLAFLLGIRDFGSTKRRNHYFVILSIIFIVFISIFQGFKGKLIILLLFYFFPLLFNIEISLKKILLIGIFGALFFYITNYIRSNGYYSTPQASLEYIMTYFNVLNLQNLLVHNYSPGFFNIDYSFLMKYTNILGITTNANFDLSVMLTKEFFPNQWLSYGATQQWPITADLYMNYYGMTLGWIPLLIYSYIISFIYKKFSQGNLMWGFIYLYEFVLIFSTLRSVFIPWNIIIVILFFLVCNIVFKYSVRRDYTL
ncbi:O-antigen polymerase [Francisella frigiditurris]|uniref:Putative membrane protein n=1 Tax=Francisella frigiditurris TaxID=1542390 RepID=A0A1J0KVL4_9GAMM|nr:O-antigen polymerase [Francisella frigiditurris]APC97829.1 putative membrane protein [Francisella frigiditurris]